MNNDPLFNREQERNRFRTRLYLKEKKYQEDLISIKKARKGFERSNSNKFFGSSSAKAYTELKKRYSDQFDPTKFDRENYEKLDGKEKWKKLKEHFENEAEMDERCLDDREDFIIQDIAIVKKIYVLD